MPTIEPVSDSLIPKTAEKPIPVRTVSTREVPRNVKQPSTPVDQKVADSTIPAESVKLSPQVTALARKEQAYRQREQALKQREADLEAKLADADKYSQLKAKLSTKDYSEAEALGLDYEGYVEYKINQTNGEDPTAEKFKSLEAEIQALKTRTEESATQEYEETVAEYRKELKSMADSNPEFSTVKRFTETDQDGKEISGVDVALQLILDSWEEDQEEVTIDDALKLTKEFLVERAKRYAALVEEPKPEVEAQRLPPPRQGSRTLTQQLQPSGIERKPERSYQQMSESERYAEARRRVLERRNLQG